MRIDLISIFRFLATVGSGLILLIAAAWGTAALYYTGHRTFAVLFGIIGLIALIALVVRLRIWSVVSIVAFLVVFGILLVWWNTLKPSNSRDWEPDVARISTSTIDGDLVTVRDIRYLDYRTETDYTVRYYDKTFDLRELNSLDLLTVYWMGPCNCPRICEFWFRRQRLSGNLSRTAKGEGRVVFAHHGDIQTVRALLRGCRREGRDPRAHRFQESAGAGLSLPHASSGRERAQDVSGLSGINQSPGCRTCSGITR